MNGLFWKNSFDWGSKWCSSFVATMASSEKESCTKIPFISFTFIKVSPFGGVRERKGFSSFLIYFTLLKRKCCKVRCKYFRSWLNDVWWNVPCVVLWSIYQLANSGQHLGLRSSENLTWCLIIWFNDNDEYPELPNLQFSIFFFCHEFTLFPSISKSRLIPNSLC